MINSQYLPQHHCSGRVIRLFDWYIGVGEAWVVSNNHADNSFSYKQQIVDINKDK